VVANGHPETHLVTVRAPFALFGTPFRATVRYDAHAHELTVWASPLSRTSTGAPLVKHSIDLAAVLGSDRTYVGFTGATGAETAVQDVLRWRLSA
jgi:Legume lectin domain